MKVFSGILGAAVLVAGFAGCNDMPMRSAHSNLEPGIQVGPSRTIQTGESTRLSARTENLVGAKAVEWSVSPNVARIAPEGQSNGGQTALFSADQPGVYVVTARADLGNGKVVASDTKITVNGRPMTSEHMNEPAPAPAPRP